jgi:hypothetical protein
MKVHEDKHGTYHYQCSVCSFDCDSLGSVSGPGLSTLSYFMVLFGFKTTREVMTIGITIPCPF